MGKVPENKKALLFSDSEFGWAKAAVREDESGEGLKGEACVG